MTGAILNDTELLRQLAAGENAAFTQVYRQYYAELFWLSKRMVGDAAPDVLADVFLRLWTNRKLFDNRQHLLAYLRVMTRNCCLDALKQDERRDAAATQLAFITDEEYEQQYFAEIIEARLFSLIRNEIDALPTHLGKVFTLSYIDGLSNSQIAEQLNLKDGSVRALKSEALKLLRASLRHIELAVIVKLMLIAGEP